MAESSSRKTGRKAGADGYSLAQSPSHLLRRAQQYAFDIYSQETGGEELTPRQFAVLVTVEQNEGLSQTDLVRLTGIDRSTLADMIARLLKRDLLAVTGDNIVDGLKGCLIGNGLILGPQGRCR